MSTQNKAVKTVGATPEAIAQDKAAQMSTKTKTVTGEGNAPRVEVDKNFVDELGRKVTRIRKPQQSGGRTQPISERTRIIEELLAQRDELLAACKALLFNAEHGNGLQAQLDTKKRARAAIANAEGKS